MKDIEWLDIYKILWYNYMSILRVYRIYFQSRIGSHMGEKLQLNILDPTWSAKWNY